MSQGVLGKTRVLANTGTIADGDSIIAYLTDSAGTLLTSTTVGSDEALDVNIVQTTGQYAEDSAHTTADVGNFVLSVRNDTPGSLVSADGDYAPLQVDSSGNLRVVSSGATTTNYEYAEDSAHTTADVGAFTLAVRNDTLGALAGTDGDYIPFTTDSSGRLWVTPPNFEYAEDSAHTSTDTGAFMLAVRNDTLGTLVDTDGDYAPLQVDSSGRLRVAGTFMSDADKNEDDAASSGDTGAFILSVRRDSTGANTSADGDYAELQTNGRGDLRVSDKIETSILQQVISVGTSATSIPGTALTGRKGIMVQNITNGLIYLGSGTVTTAGATRGLILGRGGTFQADLSDDIDLNGITATSAKDVAILEMA